MRLGIFLALQVFMFRFMLTLLVALVLLLAGRTSAAEACVGVECNGIVVADISKSRIGLAAEESEVRAQDLAELRPKMPEIWSQFRSYAYSQLPQHREENFEAVWIAMTVTTSDETIVALGLKGMWW